VTLGIALVILLSLVVAMYLFFAPTQPGRMRELDDASVHAQQLLATTGYVVPVGGRVIAAHSENAWDGTQFRCWAVWVPDNVVGEQAILSTWAQWSRKTATWTDLESLRRKAQIAATSAETGRLSVPFRVTSIGSIDSKAGGGWTVDVMAYPGGTLLVFKWIKLK